jgi:O-antigen/teichoic acid export membrane protein
MGAVAEPLIYCLIGPQWHQAATFLPYICLVMVLYPLQAINLNMLQIQGRTDIFLYLEIIKKTLAIGPICMGIFVGIYCMLISSILLGFICFFLNSYYTGKSLGYTSWAQLRDIAPSFLIAILVAVSVYFLKYIPVSYWIILPMQILVGTGVFFFICETTKLPEYIEVKEIVISYISKVSHKK